MLSFILGLNLAVASLVFASGSISGKVTLQSRKNHSNLITFKLKNPREGNAIVQTRQVSTASDGSYVLMGIPAGIYNLSAKTSNFLSQNQVLIEVADGGDASGVNFNLLGGDCDNNNVVSMKDYAIFYAAYGSRTGQPRWDPRADFNGNGQIDMQDFVILMINYAKSGVEPKISIISPPDNSLTNLPAAYVLDTIDDNKAQVSVNGLPVAVTNHTFGTSNITLNEGQNKITAIAVNKYGIKNADLVIVVLDTTAPVIAITSPQDGYVSTTQTITVSGTIDDNQAAVTVNGNTASVSNGTFNYSDITLTQGQNTITVVATDLAGNTSSNSITVTYQPTVPLAISITLPVNNTRVNTSTITVSGTVTDNTATVTVNGMPVSLNANTFSIDLALAQGTNIITAKAEKDTLSAEDTINVILDTDPPSINIYTPDNNSTTRSNIVYGRVSEDTQTVTVNGTPAELLSDFRFIGRPVLAEGAATITAQALDKAGNTGQASINITYNTQTPKVTITSPIDNSTQDISPINIQGTNTTDLEYIIVSSLPAHIDEGNFVVEGITLTSDHTVITAEGYDANDNLFEDSVFIRSPQLANYQFTEISGSAYEYDDTRPIAGAPQTLKVTLEKNGELAPNEEIRFNIAEGDGILSQSSVFTNDNGEAEVILTTNVSSSIANKVDCFVSSNPLVKATFIVYTKPGLPSTLTRVSDDSITPVPGAKVDLIVKLTDSNNNPIPNENINFQITQGMGTLSSTQVATTYYGETKVTLTVSANPNETTQITASSASNPLLSIIFTIMTSKTTVLTFNDIMSKVQQNEDKIQDLMADVTVTSNEPFSKPEKQFKLWMKGNKSKVQYISPLQKTSLIETTPDSINLNGKPFFTILEQETNPDILRTDTIESSLGDIYVLKTVITSTQGFEETTRYYVDYFKGILLKTEDEYKDQYKKEYFEIIYSSILIGDIWVMNGTVTKEKDFLENKEYITTETRSNIIINSGLPDSIFQ